MIGQIVIVGTPGCSNCAFARNFLHSKNVPFDYFDINLLDDTSREEWREHARYGMPIIQINGAIASMSQLMDVVNGKQVSFEIVPGGDK